jgi:hypothetical protein
VQPSLHRFQLRDSPDGKPITAYRAHFPGWPDGGSFSPHDVQCILDALNRIREFIGTNFLVAHCAAGMGRSPSLIVYHAIDAAATAEEKAGGFCCCDFNRQKEERIDGALNLAYVARNIVLVGTSSRSAFGWGPKQFKSYYDYAMYRAQSQDH